MFCLKDVEKHRPELNKTLRFSLLMQPQIFIFIDTYKLSY